MCKGSSLDSLGLVHFSIGLVNSVVNLPDGQEKIIVKFNLLQKNCNQLCLSKFIFRPVEMTFGLLHASYTETDFLCTLIHHLTVA